MTTWIAALLAFAGCFLFVPACFRVLRFLSFYSVVEEGTTQVYVLFGQILAVLDQPGLYFLWARIGWRALIVRGLGTVYTLDMRLDQEYLRSRPVNSEEGAPMGIGIWYEMAVDDPVSFLFKNADPSGSLRANVGNATVRCLSNMPLAAMLEGRHQMSHSVREEVAPKAGEWGYRLGSVYIRKVHFRDAAMIAQIEAKVTNRLRQVTSAIQQDGSNQVSIIRSTAERLAAVEFAKAAALRPGIVGATLQRIAQDPEVLDAMYEILETQRLIEGDGRITLVPGGTGLLASLLLDPERVARTKAHRYMSAAQ